MAVSVTDALTVPIRGACENGEPIHESTNLQSLSAVRLPINKPVQRSWGARRDRRVVAGAGDSSPKQAVAKRGFLPAVC